MATFQIFTTYDMANPIGMQADAIRGDVTLNSATGFTLAYNLASGHWVTTFTGTGYTYAQGNGQVQVTGGTINSEVANNGTQDVFSLTGASVDVIADGSLSSGAAELNLWLQGGGTIIGSSDRQSFVDYTGNHTITGGGGGDRVVFSGAQANYTITPTATGYTVKDNVGSGGTDTLNGIAYLKFSDGYYLSAPPAQSITGGLADETLSGGFGNDTINGGGGSDTVAFSGIYSNYTITHNVASNTYVVQDSTGFDGTYTLTNISYMRFTDQTLSFVGQTITETTPDDSVQTGHGDDTISGVGGHNTVVYSGPSANYTITASGLSYVVSDNVGLDGTDTLTNISTLQFTDKNIALPLTLTGGQGNDTAYTGPGNDTMDGGGGIDTAVFYGSRSNFTIAQHADGSLTVTDTTGAEGVDTLSNVERLQFDNGKVAFDMNGSAGITAKLIGAAFGLSNLQPALSGEGIGIFDLGYTLEQIAQPAINTTLFQTLAGSNSNLAFVTLVYHNVLGTGNASETDDIAYFVSLLDQHVLTQAELLVKATNCTENVQNVNLVGLATTGLEYV